MTPLKTPEEAAEILRVNPKTIRNWAKRGYIRGYQLGDLWRFSDEQLHDFREQNLNMKDR